jgi:uncharacterized protein YbaP (TraB family)
MNRRFAMIGSLVLSGLLAVSQLVAQDVAVAPAPAPAKKALFWKATSKDNVVYLLGSIHLGSKSLYPLPREIEDDFDHSALLAVEIDINHVNMAKLQGMIFQTGMYPDDDTLWNHVSPEARQRLEAFCEKYAFPVAGMAKMKPWTAAMMVSTIPLVKNGMEFGLGIDKYFLDKADQGKKRIVEIESAEEQMKLVSGITAEMLEKSLAAPSNQDPQEYVKRIQQAWISGDAAQLEKVIQSQPSDPVEFAKSMLQDRNLRMADAAEQFLQGKEPAFVVVGAAHMVGPGGVVRILQKRGYKVEQVTLSQ